MKTTISEDDAGRRLDKFLRSRFRHMPPSHIYKLIRTGRVRINGHRVKPGILLQPGMKLFLRVAPVELDAESAEGRDRMHHREHQGTAGAVQVIYEDHHLLVVNKPPYVAVHTGTGHGQGTLIDRVLVHLGGGGAGGGGFRPALTHRLDRDTSGVVLVGKTYPATRRLGEMWRDGSITKSYLALVLGRTRIRGAINRPLPRRTRSRSQTARTTYRTLAHFDSPPPGIHGTEGGKATRERGDSLSLIVALPQTGRTHQIRRHLAGFGHPVLGDRRYGDARHNRHACASLKLERQFLHAFRAQLLHPISHRPLDLLAPLPPDLEGILRRLGAEEILHRLGLLP